MPTPTSCGAGGKGSAIASRTTPPTEASSSANGRGAAGGRRWRDPSTRRPSAVDERGFDLGAAEVDGEGVGGRRGVWARPNAKRNSPCSYEQPTAHTLLSRAALPKLDEVALNDIDEILAVKAAELYYEAGKTQDEIGLALSVSRWKVGRLLVAAREHGFVRIEIVHPSARRFSLERELCGFYDLADAVVVPAARLRLRGAGAGRAGRRRLPHHAAPRAAHARRQLGPHPARGRRAAAAGLGRRRQPGADQRQRVAAPARPPRPPTPPSSSPARRRAPRPCCRAPRSSSRRRPGAPSRPTARCRACSSSPATPSAYLFSAGVVDTSSVHVDSGYLTAGRRAQRSPRRAPSATSSAASSPRRPGRRPRAQQPHARHLASTSSAPPARASPSSPGETKHRVAHAVVVERAVHDAHHRRGDRQRPARRIDQRAPSQQTTSERRSDVTIETTPPVRTLAPAARAVEVLGGDLTEGQPAPLPRTASPASTPSASSSAPPASAPAPSRPPARRWALDTIIELIDLTTLEGADTPGKVRSLVAKALTPDAGDLTHPAARRRLRLRRHGAVRRRGARRTPHAGRRRPGGVNVAAVATAFPSGRASLAVKLADTADAVAAGADEIDMVIDRGAFLSGRYGLVFDEIVAVKEACRRADGSYAHLKVILETGELNTYDNVRRASWLAHPRRRRLHQDLHRQGLARRDAARHAAHAGGRARLAPAHRRGDRREAGRRHPLVEGRDQVPRDGRRDGRARSGCSRTCSGSAPPACSTTCCCSARS